MHRHPLVRHAANPCNPEDSDRFVSDGVWRWLALPAIVLALFGAGRHLGSAIFAVREAPKEVCG